MRELPILFNAEMVRAILAGRKTVTRRPVKPQPACDCHYEMNGAGTHALHLATFEPLNRRYVPVKATSADHRLPCPYGAPGDRLYVRETWAAFTKPTHEYGECDLLECAPSEMPDRYGTDASDVVYRADGTSLPSKWRPSILMPRWASRILLDVVSVRVERVQDISEDDARAEGVKPTDAAIVFQTGEFTARRAPEMEGTARGAFACSWDSIYASGGAGWGTNPWVWRIEFRRAP